MKNLMLVFCLVIPFLTVAQNTEATIKKIIKNDNIVALNSYLKAGGDINACHSIKESTYSLLVLSIKLESKQIFKKCLELGADPNQICKDKSPLIYAIKYDKMEMFKALLAKGADKNLKTKRGKTAADYAMKYDRQDFVSLLKKE